MTAFISHAHKACATDAELGGEQGTGCRLHALLQQRADKLGASDHREGALAAPLGPGLFFPHILFDAQNEALQTHPPHVQAQASVMQLGCTQRLAGAEAEAGRPRSAVNFARV